MKQNKNSLNKLWWDNNPMTYIEGEMNGWDEQKRFIHDQGQFKKLNKDYLDTNPYLKSYFEDDNVKHYLKGKTILDIGAGWGTSALLLESCGAIVPACAVVIELAALGGRAALDMPLITLKAYDD